MGLRLRVLCCLLFTPLASSESYSEELLFTRLPSDNLLAQFRFVLRSDSLNPGPDYLLFPRSIGELVGKYGVRELTLTMTQGVWRSEHYGIPPQPSSTSGAQLSARFTGNESTVDSRWSSLVHSLNGAFCASLSSMLPTETFEPRSNPLGDYPTAQRLFARSGALPRETVCTENLTPWRKLLPCKQNGLISLLNPSRLYASPFHSIGLQLYPECEGSKCHFRLELFASVLFDLPIAGDRSLDWTFQSLFARNLAGKCNVAQESNVIVRIEKDASLIDKPVKTERIGDDEYAIYHTQRILNDKTEANFGVTYKRLLDMRQAKPHGEISIFSTLGGCDQYSGTHVTVLRNLGKRPIEATLVQVIPWWLRIFYHTIQFECSDFNKNKLVLTLGGRFYIPSKDRLSPGYSENNLTLPADSECRIQFQFEKGFLRMVEYPPDANHGLYIPGAELRISDVRSTAVGDSRRTATEHLFGEKKSENAVSTVLFGNILLVPLPVPDFSMPFNVICFVATGISLCFSAVHPFSTRIFVPVNGKLPGRSLFARVLRMILIILLIGASYIHYHNMSLNEIRRELEKFFDFDRLNSMHM